MDAHASRTSFIAEFTKANRKLRTMFDARVKQQGLTLARARLLLHLAKEEGVTQRELADVLEVEQPSMVTLIDALEKKGFVTRETVEGDRRAKGIYLTEMARAEADKVQAYADELSQQILAGVDDADLIVAVRVLRQISVNVGAA